MMGQDWGGPIGTAVDDTRGSTTCWWRPQPQQGWSKFRRALPADEHTHASDQDRQGEVLVVERSDNRTPGDALPATCRGRRPSRP